jgi:hypothetical protein
MAAISKLVHSMELGSVFLKYNPLKHHDLDLTMSFIVVIGSMAERLQPRRSYQRKDRNPMPCQLFHTHGKSLHAFLGQEMLLLGNIAHYVLALIPACI